MSFKSEFLLLSKGTEYIGLIFNKQQNGFQWIRLPYYKYGAFIDGERIETPEVFYLYNYSKTHCALSEINIFDLIEIEYKPVPLSIESENCVLVKGARFLRGFSFDEFDYLCRRFPVINNANLLNTTREFLTTDEAQQFHNSLMLVDVDNFHIQGNKARFFYNGEKYSNYLLPPFTFMDKKYSFEKCKIILSISQKPSYSEGAKEYLLKKRNAGLQTKEKELEMLREKFCRHYKRIIKIFPPTSGPSFAELQNFVSEDKQFLEKQP